MEQMEQMEQMHTAWQPPKGRQLPKQENDKATRPQMMFCAGKRVRYEFARDQMHGGGSDRQQQQQHHQQQQQQRRRMNNDDMSQKWLVGAAMQMGEATDSYFGNPPQDGGSWSETDSDGCGDDSDVFSCSSDVEDCLTSFMDNADFMTSSADSEFMNSSADSSLGGELSVEDTNWQQWLLPDEETGSQDQTLI